MRWPMWIMLFFIGFRSLVISQWHFENGHQIKTRCRVCLIYAMCKDDIEAWWKRPSLACSRNAGCWYKLLQIIENLSSYTNQFICDLLGMRAVERSYTRPLAGRLFYRLCLRGLCCRDKDVSSTSWDYGAVYQAKHAAKREWGYFCTASNTESGPSYKSRIVIYHIKEVTAILCHLLPIPE